jgi:hypothetical protein
MRPDQLMLAPTLRALGIRSASRRGIGPCGGDDPAAVLFLGGDDGLFSLCQTGRRGIRYLENNASTTFPKRRCWQPALAAA